MTLQGGSWENKYSYLILLLPSDLLPGHPLAKPNQRAESKRVLGCNPYEPTSQGREPGEDHRVVLAGRWRTFSLPIDPGKMEPSLKVGKLIDQVIL